MRTIHDPQPHTATPKRFQGDDGSIIAEAALVMPILLMFLCGIGDFGGAWRQRTTIQGAMRTATRTEANVGSDVTINMYADQYSMSALWAGMSKANNISLQKVIVYKLPAYNSPTPSGCISTTPNAAGAGIAGSCNVYSASQVQNSGTTWTLNNVGCTTGWDRFYCPRTRKNTLTGPPDWLGIWAQVTYTPYTKMFGASFTMTDVEVTRIEPQAG